MKKCFLLLLCGTWLLSCRKNTNPIACLRIKVIGYDYCSPAAMGAQILAGPVIGERYGNTDNVISIYGLDKTRLVVGDELYVQVRQPNAGDAVVGFCLALYPGITFSHVKRVAVSTSGMSCY